MKSQIELLKEQLKMNDIVVNASIKKNLIQSIIIKTASQGFTEMTPLTESEMFILNTKQKAEEFAKKHIEPILKNMEKNKC